MRRIELIRVCSKCRTEIKKTDAKLFMKAGHIKLGCICPKCGKEVTASDSKLKYNSMRRLKGYKRSPRGGGLRRF